MTDPLNLEPPDGDYVRYIESLQKRGTGSLKPLEPEDFMGGTEVPEKSAPSLKSLLKTLHIPGTSGEDESRRKALARMEEASRGATQSPAALPARKAKVDPALKFVSTAFAMFGLIGIVAGADSGDEAPIIPRRPALRRPSLITFAYFLRRIRKRSAFSRAAHWTARAKACQSSLHHSRIEAQRG